MYDYGIVSAGSYFGEISVLLDEPAEFSYMFNPHCGKPLMMLTLTSKEFMDIVEKFPEVKEQLTARAIQRKEFFRNYKTITLIRLMRSIIKNPSISIPKKVLKYNQKDR